MPGLSAEQAETKNYIRFRDFQTMDTQSAREALPPNRLAWCENLEIVGPNQLVCCQGPANPIQNLPGELISSQFAATYNNVDYIICFCESGSAYQVVAATGAATKFALAGTFSSTPDMTTWSSQRILIADAIAGYCTWDGHVFVQSGGVSPNIVITNGGSGYVNPPTVTISGGSGTGATAHAVLTAGVVTSIVLDSAGFGYKAGDTLAVSFVPASTTAATAIVWPFLTGSVTTLAIYSGRVWLAGARLIQWTGTSGFDDTNPAHAAGSTTINDADLVHVITALRSLNNFLYIFGDNSIKQIGTVTVSGSTTVFNIVTLSSDQGTPFPRAIASYNRLILFANKVGVYAVLGASVEKVSDQMDGIFAAIDFSQPIQAAVQDLHTSLHTFLLLVRYKDPVAGITRSLILCFYKNRWFVANQGQNMLCFCTAAINGITETFSSSGSDITQIFQSATAVPIILRTAMADNNADVQKRMTQAAIAMNSAQVGVMFVNFVTENGSNPMQGIGGGPNGQFNTGQALIWENISSQVITWRNNALQTIVWLSGGFLYQRVQGQMTGCFVGLDLSGSFVGSQGGGGTGGNSPGFTLNGLAVEYQEGKLLSSKMSA